jgi:hypothetical protein
MLSGKRRKYSRPARLPPDPIRKPAKSRQEDQDDDQISGDDRKALQAAIEAFGLPVVKVREAGLLCSRCELKILHRLQD